MSRKHTKENGHNRAGFQKPLSVYSIDPSTVRGTISSGSAVYIEKSAATNLPQRGHPFIAGFQSEENTQYFTANRVGGNDQRATIQLGREHSPASYQSGV